LNEEKEGHSQNEKPENSNHETSIAKESIDHEGDRRLQNCKNHLD